MRSSRFFVRVLLSYSYLLIGLLSFGTIMLLRPDLLLHPITVVAAVAFIAGWIWIAKTYLGFKETARYTP